MSNRSVVLSGRLTDCPAESRGATRTVAIARRYTAVFIAPPWAWVTTALHYYDERNLHNVAQTREPDKALTLRQSVSTACGDIRQDVVPCDGHRRPRRAGRPSQAPLPGPHSGHRAGAR